MAEPCNYGRCRYVVAHSGPHSWEPGRTATVFLPRAGGGIEEVTFQYPAPEGDDRAPDETRPGGYTDGQRIREWGDRG